MTEQQATSLAEEIRLLVELVAEHAAPWLDGLVAAGHGMSSGSPPGVQPGEPGEHGPPGCGWCPLCAVVEVFRGERPEFVARLLEQAAQLVALLRAVLADRWAPEEGVHMPGFRPAPRESPGEKSTVDMPRVQHVAVRPRARWRPGGEG